ncbi:MAG: formamidopyrimidine-DNA glycosylase [Opitutaceae bacterium]|nr:formamidopyrimidine-DNA glycosylase [Opitutaceae bacterium]
MPELPDITTYLAALEKRALGHVLDRVRLNNPFLLRTVSPPLKSFEGHRVTALRRIGKRIAFGFEHDAWLVLHLMIAGRLHWHESPGARLAGRAALAAFDFVCGCLVLTEAGTTRRAALHAVSSTTALATHDPGGIEPLEASLAAFTAALTRESHTLKRALTDPHLFSGIGNAYADEILHAARLSPVQLTRHLTPADIARLHAATRDTLTLWTRRLLEECGDGFPDKVTAFRPGMAAHGRFGKPCPACGATIQRIRYAANETNYCPACQTGGKLLADRALSRLLKDDWPRTPEALEELTLRLAAATPTAPPPAS